MVSGATPTAAPPRDVVIAPPHGEDQALQQNLTDRRSIAQDELALVEQRQTELRRIIDGCNAALSAMDASPQPGPRMGA